jgi:Ca-activated chloride channel family protein
MTPDQKDAVVRQLDAWDPASGQDLPDAVAVALDADPELRARFDARFAAPSPAQLGEPTLVPDTLPERVLPAPRSRRTWPLFAAGSGGVLALAASALLVVGGLATFSARTMDESVVVAEPPVARPALNPDAGEGARGRREEGKVGKGSIYRREIDPEVAREAGVILDTEAQSQLNSMGYLVPSDGPNGLGKEVATGDHFEDPGVSPFRSTLEQPLSTFSIDVDRGSFTWARGQLRAGFLPDPSSVRTEEFVNALGYDAPQPESGPFAVQFEGSPSPFSDHELVRITVAARDPAMRKPVHLTFLVDTSGSMQGPDRLGLVKESLGLLVDHLTPEDTVAIVTYAGSAGVVLPPTSAAKRDVVKSALGRLEAGGSTAMGQGIELAYALAHQTQRKGEENRVIIASDGDANVGVVGTGDLSAAIRGYALDGITLTTLGFGQGNYQDARMEQLANDGDGNYFYVDSIDEARHVFVDQLAATLEVVARDVKIQVAWDPGQVTAWRQLGYENRVLKAEDFRDDAVDAGEVGAGHTVTALYEITRAPNAAGSTLATVSLRGKPPGEDAASTEWTYRMPVGAMAPSVVESSRDHRMALGVAAFAEHLRRSPYAEAVPLTRVEGILQGAVREGHPEDREVVLMVQAARRLAGER